MDTRKLKIVPHVWDHTHGWTAATLALSAGLHADDGVPCFMSVEDQVFLAPGRPPASWVGFTHSAPYSPHRFSLEYFVGREWYALRTFSETCAGLFCLAETAAEFLRSWVECPVSVVAHPTRTPRVRFSPERYAQNPDPMLVTVGHVNRDFQAVAALPLTRPRPVVLDCGYGGDYWGGDRFRRPLRGRLPHVSVLPWCSPSEYDELLAENLVFLPLKECVACNAIVECIVRTTPVLLPRVGGAEEYLGSDYPGFYRTLAEAARLAGDGGWVRATHDHLKAIDTARFSHDTFVRAVAESEVFRSLAKLRV